MSNKATIQKVDEPTPQFLPNLSPVAATQTNSGLRSAAVATDSASVTHTRDEPAGILEEACRARFATVSTCTHADREGHFNAAFIRGQEERDHRCEEHPRPVRERAQAS